jgi:hypothetical protein
MDDLEYRYETLREKYDKLHKDHLFVQAAGYFLLSLPVKVL